MIYLMIFDNSTKPLPAPLSTSKTSALGRIPPRLLGEKNVSVKILKFNETQCEIFGILMAKCDLGFRQKELKGKTAFQRFFFFGM